MRISWQRWRSGAETAAAFTNWGRAPTTVTTRLSDTVRPPRGLRQPEVAPRAILRRLDAGSAQPSFVDSAAGVPGWMRDFAGAGLARHCTARPEDVHFIIVPLMRAMRALARGRHPQSESRYGLRAASRWAAA